jgi:hypothetical protein
LLLKFPKKSFSTATGDSAHDPVNERYGDFTPTIVTLALGPGCGTSAISFDVVND